MAAQTVTAPRREPRKFDLKSVAEFQEDARVGANQTINYEALPCQMPQGTVALCWEDLEDRDPKEGTDAGWGDAIFDPFVQYAGASCYIGPDQRYAEQARAILDAGEDDAITDKIADWVVATGTDLSDQDTPLLALAEVEQALRDDYRGRGTILVSPYTATILGSVGAIKPDGDSLITTAGSKVGVVAGVPKEGVMGLGAIKVIHSPTREAEANNFAKNTTLAIAERIYTAIVDCDFAVYATITTTP